MQKISPIHWFILEMQILESQDLKDHAHFLSPPSKNYQPNFWLSWIFFQYIKHQFNPLIPFWDTANFSIIRPEWPHPFLTMATPIFFNQPFNFHYSLSTCKKNQAFSSLCSWDIVNLKMLQSDWPRTFWPISQEPDLSKVWDKCRNTANNMNVLYRPNSEKNNKFSNKSKKSYFWPIFSFFVTKKIVFKSSSVTHNNT